MKTSDEISALKENLRVLNEQKVHDEVAAKGGKVYVIRSLDEAAALIGAQ